MNKSPQQQANEIKANLVKVAVSKKSFLEVEATKQIKDSFFDFSKAPVASGESQDNSLAQILGNGFGLLINTAINTKQAIFFIDPQNPKNPNYKYGNRNPMIKAEEKIINTILKNL